MAIKRYPPTDPREWLNRAKSNLALAMTAPSGAFYEELCFEAQQAAEKAIKAVFVRRGAVFPFIHDLDKLLTLLAKDGVKVPKFVRQADELTPFAVMTRYPGIGSPVTKRQYRRAVRLAKSVVGWAERHVMKP